MSGAHALSIQLPTHEPGGRRSGCECEGLAGLVHEAHVKLCSAPRPSSGALKDLRAGFPSVSREAVRLIKLAQCSVDENDKHRSAKHQAPAHNLDDKPRLRHVPGSRACMSHFFAGM